ncbi:hypothetical protein FRC12_003633 [Ceratobasidium sp. 428]|nr:hypothetical protein FRC12_003633 [Ceratobasidium sp. 428]
MTQRLTISRVNSTALRASLPIPGLNELLSVTELFIEGLQDSPFEHARCSTAARNIESLVDVAARVIELDPSATRRLERYDIGERSHTAGLTTNTSNLDEIKNLLTELAVPRRHSFGKSKRKLQALEDLEHRISALIKTTKLELKALKLEMQAEAELSVINPHEIHDRVNIDSHWRWRQHRRKMGLEAHERGERKAVTTCNLSGRIGRMSVIYRTYDGDNESEVARRVRRDLRLYTRLKTDPCISSRIGTVMGVTKGVRLNGIVLLSATLPPIEFAHKVTSPRVFAKFMREIDAYTVQQALEQCDRGFRIPDSAEYLYVEDVHVDIDGHVTLTVAPYRGAVFPYDSRTWIYYHRDFYPSYHLALEVLTAGGSFEHPTKPRTKFLEDLSNRKSCFSELQVLQLADEAGVLPYRTNLRWSNGDGLPPFTVLPNELGAYCKRSADDGLAISEWMLLDQTLVGHNHSTEHISGTCNWVSGTRPLEPTATTGEDGWYTYEQSFSNLGGHGPGLTLQHYQHTPLSSFDWKTTVDKWAPKIKSSHRAIRIDSLALCRRIFFTVSITRSKTLPDSGKLYYHRRPSARSDPASFWGYLSTNPDPLALEDNVRSKGWVLEYELLLDVHRITDDWGYRYRQRLDKSLRSMPGSFPLTEDAQGDEGDNKE